MRLKKLTVLIGACLLVFGLLMTACDRKRDSTSTPGTGEEHSLPSVPAGYPAGGGLPTPEPGYPQP
jgi:hypothetical protein